MALIVGAFEEVVCDIVEVGDDLEAILFAFSYFRGFCCKEVFQDDVPL